ncbi:MAG: hypothetical protein NUV83_01960 [Candidatus Wolfebacteria bacterium]|nr:hypothetical protein [Candidatus Wolfebacteria bacterium]
MDLKDELRKKFPISRFEYSPKIKIYGGAFLCGTPFDSNISANEVFDLLNTVYGPPNLDTDGVMFIDKKTTWTWVFKTKHGLLTCYDFKGGWSVGYGHDKTKDFSLSVSSKLRKEGENFLSAVIRGIARMKVLESDLEKENKKNPLVNILRAIGAARILLTKACAEGSLMEGLVLYASLIDGLLRMAIVLKEQIIKKTMAVNEDLIFQKGKKYISERNIIAMAKDLNIIDKNIYGELNELYDFRNRAVHRFFITHLKYAELPPYLIRYEEVFNKINEIIYTLESEQIKKKVGMTVLHTSTEEEKNESIKDSLKKIDSEIRHIKPPPRKFIFPNEDY